MSPSRSILGRCCSVQSDRSQFGVVNLNLGLSSQPDVEAAVLSDVASYGRQLGRISDALVVLLKHFRPEGELSAKERRAIRDLQRIIDDIADVKQRHFERATPAPSPLSLVTSDGGSQTA